MFGIGFGELAIIAIVILLAVGPDRMPTMMRGIGKALREFRKASQDLRAQTGIDELLREDLSVDFRGTGRHGIPGERKRIKPRPLTEEEVAAERPLGGVDVDWEQRRAEGSRGTKPPEAPEQ
jgi:Tat protein translocase TatB subunit